jgi:hypothetical protein
MKKALTAAGGETATVRDILDGGATPQVIVEPLAPHPTRPGLHGTVLLVPVGLEYYFSLAYISGEEGSLTVSLPEVQGILVMDLPKGMLTPAAEINAAIESGTGGGPPSIVGPS